MVAPFPTTQVHHVDGPMLPHLNHFSSTSSQTDANDDNIPPRATTSLVPILTPPISSSSSSNEEDSQQYIIVPNTKRIVVRSAHHGKRVCHLLVHHDATDDGDNYTTSNNIRAVALTWSPRKEPNEGEGGPEGDWIILAGCNNAIIQEWAIVDILLSDGASNNNSMQQGRGPRRSFQLSCETMKDLDLIHLTSISSQDDTSSKHLSSDGGAVLYGLVEGTDNESNERSTWLVRCEIPPFVPPPDGEDQYKLVDLPVKALAPVKTVSSKAFNEETSQNKHICLKRKDAIFGLLAAYRPSLKVDGNDRMIYMMDDQRMVTGSGNVFVVMCSSHGLAIYRDSIRQPSQPQDENVVDASHSLVHFTKSMKSSSQYYSKDQSAFSSVAISPGTKDLAVGRANGHIEILDNVFENVAKYLKQLGRKNAPEESLQHPESVTVKRTVHWHAHPVRALAFMSAYGRRHKGDTNATSLLSGGEESVIVTWQLDRNYHRPSNFIARVGQGGIVYMLHCQYSGRIIVFCSDNSIQCYNGSNYERNWAEQCLASMALHEEEDVKKQQEGECPKRGPIIMAKDPITSFPMLTNLPGSPGMVHWYDPKSKSVVGTLEVAPYNRVSRRDPLTDPHIPAPTVTHMAFGHDGKDMVTVDVSWTENNSVGSKYDLAGPFGTTPMNVCTSIKFWMFVEASKGGKSDQRKRRNGDMPMSYALISSMAAPHGREGEVCALAVAPDGGVACTLSKQEDAFRVWVKNTSSGVASTLWKCLYKVKTPSGHANLLSQRITPALLNSQLVTFSSDGTVLSVSYGPNITLWDHSNATLLTSLTLDDNGATTVSEDIQTVNFLTQHDDVMLLTTASRIGIKSPFGGPTSCYLGDDEWSFDVGSFGNEGLISAVVPLYDFDCKDGATGGYFAISIVKSENGLKSIVSIISRDEGKVVCAEGSETPLRWQVDGIVQCLCPGKCVESFVQLFAITQDCEMLSLIYEADGHSREERVTASRLEVQSTRNNQAPALKLGVETADAKPSVKRRKVSIGISTGLERHAVGFEFPALSGKFTSSFIAQNLKRK